ncbi:MAG: hypothetical protein EBX35_01075, partial [Planctomycetia bacterium]|nr:hypothetical protein [Planctomycetia bacterium]
TTALTFGGSTAYTATNDIGSGTFQLNRLTVSNTGATTIAAAVAANTLSFAGTNPALVINAGAGATTISNGLTYGIGTAITNNAGTLLTLGGIQAFGTSTTVTISNTGAGGVTLADGITYSGTTSTINLSNTGSGTFSIGNMGAVSGTLNINAGTVTFAGNTGGDLFGGSLTLNVAAGATFNFNGNGETMGAITGGGTITGANVTMQLTGNYTWAGALTGTAAFSTGAANCNYTFTGANTSTGSTTIVAGSTLSIGNGGTTGSVAGSVVNNGALTINRSDALTYSGVISGTGTLTKQGVGVLTLGGANTYSGGTTIPDGTANTVGGLAVTTATGLGTGPLTVGTAGPSAATVASANAAFLNVSNAAAVTLANNIALPTTPASATVYSLQKTGGGTTATGTNLLLSGIISGGNANTTLMLNSSLSGDFSTSYQLSGVNTLTGKVRVNRGAVILDNANALGTATLEVQSNANTVLTTGGNVRLNGAFTLSNNVVIGTANNTISSLGNTAGISGVISGTAAWGKLGTGTLVLTGTNTISGAASVLEGTLQIGNGGTTGSLPTGTAFTTNGTLAFNRSDAITYSGVIGGTGGVSQRGTGTTTLTGANTYTGVTTIAAGGTLQIGSGGTSGVLPGDVTNNGTLTLNRSDTVTFAGAISGAGGVTKLGAGTTSLTGTLSYTGPTTVNAGILAVSPFGTTSGTTVAGNAGLTVVNGAVPGTFTTPTLSLGSAGSTLRFALASGNPTAPLLNVTAAEGLNLNGGTHTLTLTNSSTLSVGQFVLVDYDSATPITSGFTLSALPGRSAGSLVYNTANTSVDLNVTGADTITYTGAIDNFWDAGTAVDTGGTMNFKVVGVGPNNGNATNFISGDAVRFDDTAAGPTTPFSVNLTTAIAPLSVTVATVANAYTFQGAGSLAGSGSLTMQGTNTLTLLTNNTYSGPTTVSAGTLVIGDGGTTGSIGSGPLVNNAAVVVNRSDSVTIAGPISGTGTLTKSGPNALTLSGAYTSSGNTDITGGTLNLSTTANYTYSGGISGAGALAKLATGTVTLTGATAHTGGTSIVGGTLQIGGGGTSGVLAGDVANSGTLAFNRSNDSSYAGVISGTGAVTKLGGGTLTLTGTNTASGVTTISAGTLRLGNGGVTGSVAGGIAGAGTLLVNRSDDFALANAMSGTLALSKTGANTVTLTGTNTQTGPVTISQGVLSIALSTNLGGAVTANLNGGTLRVTGAYSDTTQTFNAGPAGGTLDIAPGVAIVKTGGLVTGVGNTLTITGGGTLALQSSGASNLSNVVVQNGVYRHTSARYLAANTTPYSVTVQPGGTLLNWDTTSFTGTAYFPFGNLSGVAGSSLTLNGDGASGGAGATITTMFGAYLHALGETSTTATNAATSTIAVPITLASTSRFTLAVGSDGTRSASDRIVDSLVGGVSGAGGLILDGDGNGTLAIATVAATYQGATRVAAGTLRVGLTNALPTGTAVTLGGTTGDNVPNSSGTLALNGFAQEIAGLATLGSGAANRVVGGAATLSTLTVNLASGSQTFAGLLGGAGTNESNLGLVKSGAGLLTLGGQNTYSGGTTVTAGTLVAPNASALGLGDVTIAAGGTLKLGVTPLLGSGRIALNQGGVLRVAGGVSAPLAGLSPLGGWQIDPSTLGLATAAGILAGTVPAGGTTLTGSWDLAGGGDQYSDVLSLSGTGTGNAFVLSMSYSATAPANLLAALNIAQRPGPGGEFVPVGTSAQGVGVPWTSAFTTVGQYGVDTSTQTVWVVTDQGTQFVVVPEPSTVALGGAAMLGLAVRRVARLREARNRHRDCSRSA